MPQAILSVNLSYLPPNVAAAVTAMLGVTSNYTAMEAGTLDIPNGATSGTVYALSFGTVDSGAQAFYFKNTNNQDMTLRLNGSADIYRIPPNGQIFIAHPTVATGGVPTPLLSASVVLTGTQVGNGTVNYYVFGS